MKRYITVVFGLLLLGIGIFLTKIIIEPRGVMRILSYVCIGLGCKIFGDAAGKAISCGTVKKYPDIDRQIKINQLDERNVTIRNCAKAKAYDMMTFIFGVLIITFVFMEIDKVAIFLLVFVYLFVVGYALYYRCKFDKEM